MVTNRTPHKIVIVDDHVLFAGSLEALIQSFPGFEVLFHAKNGVALQQQLTLSKELPDIILLDINMPVMNGFETMEWLAETHPNIKVLALSMEDDENTILSMLRKGANGYLLKDIHPERLKVALNEVISKGYYHSDKVAETLLHSLQAKKEAKDQVLKENEMRFIQLACTEKTYKEIAQDMNLSPKTIDGYRNDLFRNLNVKNRVGLVIYALKNNLFKV